MDPHQQWCHNPNCRAYGRVGEGHIVIHSQKERRYRCERCGRTFTATKDIALYRMHKPKWLVLTVVTLLAYGCPVQAIVATFSLDERTVARWQREAGLQGKRVHEHLIEAGRVQLLQVQADEIRVKARRPSWRCSPPPSFTAAQQHVASLQRCATGVQPEWNERLCP